MPDRRPAVLDAGRVDAEHVQVGDLVAFLGNTHLIAELLPYRHPSTGDEGVLAIAADGFRFVFYATVGA